MTEWMDISSAPKNPVGRANGPIILVFSKFNHGVYQARWVASGESGDWQPVGATVSHPAMARHYLTHWQPLPSPPTPTNDTQSKTLARAV